MSKEPMGFMGVVGAIIVAVFILCFEWGLLLILFILKGGIWFFQKFIKYYFDSYYIGAIYMQ